MNLTADDILNTRPSDRGRIFPASRDAARKVFKALAAKWHPDVCAHRKAAEVFAHLIALRDAGAPTAKSKVTASRILETKDGKRLGLSPFSLLKGDAAEIAVLQNSVTWIYGADTADLAEREMTKVSSMHFADDSMKAQMTPFLTSISKRIDLSDGGVAVVMPRKRDEILLADIMRMKGIIPEKHAAWIASGLLNIACWLEWAGIIHGAISPEHILVSPESHRVRLVGGWSFATEKNARPIALPGRTLDLVPRLRLSSEVVTGSLDLELIRRTVRELLGDPAGTQLLHSPLPRPLATWLIMPPAKTAVQDYSDWISALEAAWGPRRFHHWNLHAEDMYT